MDDLDCPFIVMKGYVRYAIIRRIMRQISGDMPEVTSLPSKIFSSSLTSSKVTGFLAPL